MSASENAENEKSILSEMIRDLKQQRDELRLQIHLGSQELKDELDKLEEKLAELTSRFEPVKEAVEETAEDVWESLKLVAGEVKEGFQRIRKAL